MLTQFQLASKLGVDPNSVSRWERGLVPPSKEAQVKISEIDFHPSEAFVINLLNAPGSHGSICDEDGTLCYMAAQTKALIPHEPVGMNIYEFAPAEYIEMLTLIGDRLYDDVSNITYDGDINRRPEQSGPPQLKITIVPVSETRRFAIYATPSIDPKNGAIVTLKDGSTYQLASFGGTLKDYYKA